jgi:hypothetical protein
MTPQSLLMKGTSLPKYSTMEARPDTRRPRSQRTVQGREVLVNGGRCAHPVLSVATICKSMRLLYSMTTHIGTSLTALRSLAQYDGRITHLTEYGGGSSLKCWVVRMAPEANLLESKPFSGLTYFLTLGLGSATRADNVSDLRTELAKSAWKVRR